MPLRGLEGASRRLLGFSREPLGVSLERPGDFPESRSGHVGSQTAEDKAPRPFLERSWNSLGARLGLTEVALEVPWAVLGPSWAVLGLSEAVLGPPWAPLGDLWAP